MKKLSIGKPTSDTAVRTGVANTLKRESSERVDLNFKVSEELRREWKMFAVTHDLTQREVLELAFTALKEKTIRG
jgi:hypothetical protein